MAFHGFFLMLLVANSMALWNANFGIRSWSPGRARTFECTGPGVFCDSCTTSVFCTGAGADPMPQPSCTSGQVCGGTAPTSACIDLVGNQAGDCDCDTIENSGFLVDPYDASKYFLCIPPEAQYFLSCPDGETFSIEDKRCMQATTTTTTPPSTVKTDVSQEDSAIDCSTEDIGLHTNDPTCQTYTACYSQSLPGLLLTCDGDKVFDSSKLRCVSKCELAPTPFSCSAGDAGALPDTSDCTIFHVCSNGAAITPPAGVPCPDGQVFESMSMTCVAPSTDVVCPEFNTCWAAYCDACGGPCPEPLMTSITTDISITSSTISSTSTSLSTTTSSTTSSTDKTTTSTTSSTSSTTSTPSISSTTSTTSSPSSISTTTPTTTITTSTTTATTTLTTAAATGPPDCNNSQGIYENPADCKKFYSCQSGDAGSYEPVLYSCPGDLVFIPSIGYCSFQKDLPAAPACIAS